MVLEGGEGPEGQNGNFDCCICARCRVGEQLIYTGSTVDELAK